MGRPCFVEKTPPSDWGGSRDAPDGPCREFEEFFLAGRCDSSDFRFLFAGKDGSGDTTLREVCILVELLFLSLIGESETGDPGS
jgi:hypothetical protein